MKKAENISLFCYLLSVSAGIYPVLLFLCLNGMISRFAALGGVFLLSGISAFLSRITPEKYSGKSDRIYPLLLTAAALFIAPDAPFFYRASLGVIVLILSIFMQEKRESTITGVYAFVLITFADVVFCFVTSYTFPSLRTALPLFLYLIYALCFFIMMFTRSSSRFLRGSKAGTVRIILFPATAIALFAMLSFPLSELASKGVKGLLKLVFGNAGGGNTNRPAQVEADLSYVTDALDVSEGTPVFKYIIITAAVLLAVFLIAFLYREIMDFFERMFDSRKAVPHNEEIKIHDEYTDYISQITPSDNSNGSLKAKKIWKKKLSEYRRMEWSEAKMKAALELAQNGLILSGTQIRECDTVLDIEKNLPENIKPLWHKAAVCYMNCRYDEMAVNANDEQVFERLLNEVIKMQ